ncbi:uncharacterized protein I206_100772 [Kwoniella pini CBS 10737]|uniref:Uncharacterized protein n=1 Tax=Kwoniella pini CBS 10737 TaxID=1296096 RepID=A0A1B9ICX6_9TREE|nr:uncharacterized protein I206_00555 [Kwoniella pini CBS 10737]OCF53254.1 hypothetical protein I206_00555 [Kwoniella pini CBS 10737]
MSSNKDVKDNLEEYTDGLTLDRLHTAVSDDIALFEKDNPGKKWNTDPKDRRSILLGTRTKIADKYSLVANCPPNLESRVEYIYPDEEEEDLNAEEWKRFYDESGKRMYDYHKILDGFIEDEISSPSRYDIPRHIIRTYRKASSDIRSKNELRDAREIIRYFGSITTATNNMCSKIGFPDRYMVAHNKKVFILDEEKSRRTGSMSYSKQTRISSIDLIINPFLSIPEEHSTKREDVNRAWYRPLPLNMIFSINDYVIKYLEDTHGKFSTEGSGDIDEISEEINWNLVQAIQAQARDLAEGRSVEDFVSEAGRISNSHFMPDKTIRGFNMKIYPKDDDPIQLRVSWLKAPTDWTRVDELSYQNSQSGLGNGEDWQNEKPVTTS